MAQTGVARGYKDAVSPEVCLITQEARDLEGASTPMNYLIASGTIITAKRPEGSYIVCKATNHTAPNVGPGETSWAPPPRHH